MRRTWFRNNRYKPFLLLAAFFVYMILFWTTYNLLGIFVIAFSLMPVVVGAWLYGRKTGVVAAIFAIFLGIFLPVPLTHLLIDLHNIGFLLASTVLLVLGFTVGSMSDSKRRVDKELKDNKETELWYRSIFDGVNDAVFVESVDGKVLDVNVRACEIFGWTRDEFLTKTIRDMVPSEYHALLPDEQDENTVSAKAFETMNIRANGELFPVSVSGSIQKIGDEKRLLIVVRDITEQKEFEAALKQQHQFLSHVIESLSQPFYVINVSDYSIAIANSAARGKYALDERTTCHALTHHRDTPCGGEEHPCPLQEVLQKRSVVRQEHIHYDEDGQPRIFEIHGYPVFNSQGKIVQMIESSQDITERKHSEEKIQILGRAVEQSQDGMAIADLDGVIIFVNQAWATMHGYAVDEIIGKPLAIFYTEEQLQKEVAPLNQRVLEEGAAQGEIGHKRKDNSTFPTWMSVGVLKDNNGKTTGLVASAHDITERKKTEEELLKLYRATNQSSASIVITNLEGKIEHVNPAFTEITGYSKEEALGKNPRILQSGTHPPEFYADLWETITSGNVWRGEFCNKNRQGEIFWESVSIAPVNDANGKITHYVAVKEDITEKKNILAEMEMARDAAEAAAQAKADFLANMSHEIRTPLNAIYGMTSLMLDTPLNAEQQDFIETIRGGGETLLRVINDILDFSKIEAGKMELEQQPFSLRTSVEDTLDLLAEKASEKMLELAYFIEDGTPTVVVGDVTRLRQILVNLLNNAIKFTDTGEVVINVKSLLVEDNQYELHFSVRDTGIGIPADKTDKLFKSFSQVDTSTTRKYGGTGLGLAISNYLAQNMGGTMWVESEEGKGSTFHFTLLVTAQAGEESSALYQDAPRLTNKRILIVDDNATNRLILMKQTESWGMKPCAAASGAEALALLAQGKTFDIGIFDMQMPEMDGFTLAEKVSQRKTGLALPLIILTSIKRDKSRAVDAKITAFLSKPIKTSNLFNILMSVVDAVPVHQKQTKKLVSIDPEMAKRHPLRILLAEDNMINQKVASKILSRLGYRVDLAGNGIEAIEALERQTYDVVFMDIQMPEMDGDEATQRIRAKWAPERQPHIIAMTAHALEGDRDKYIQRGMDDYVSKPVSVEALIIALEKAKQID